MSVGVCNRELIDRWVSVQMSVFSYGVRCEHLEVWESIRLRMGWVGMVLGSVYVYDGLVWCGGNDYNRSPHVT